MQSARSNWTKLTALTVAEWRVLLAASLLLPVAFVAVRAGGLDACLRRLARPIEGRNSQSDAARSDSTVPGALSTAEVARVAALVGIAARYSPLPVTCLSRSIVLAWVLRRHGVDTRLRFGVRLTDGRLGAHAWLERDGVPINDAPAVDRQYLPFPETSPRERVS
jgi:hypothetical protein